MSKRNKILCVILVIIFIASIIITGVIGLNVAKEYSAGTSITFEIGKEFDNKDIKNIAKEIWNNEDALIQKVEVYKESVLIKVKEASDEQLQILTDKINEKYELNLTKEDLVLVYNSNVKLRDILNPYIIPLLIATGLIVVYYSVRFKGVREILELLLKLVIAGGIMYSIYAITRLPINFLTMPIGMIVYAGVVIWVTMRCEKKDKSNK